MRVGDYVRTKSGFIDKVININDFREPSMKYALEQPSWNDDVIFIGDEDISKSSSEIIDLIEVRDLVKVKWGKDDENIFEVIALNIEDKEIGIFQNDFDIFFVGIENIKSIVTKEQFESMEYRIEE